MNQIPLNCKRLFCQAPFCFTRADVPDPPGKPFAETTADNKTTLSWYGSGYDGGSTITAYILEMAKVR